MKKAFITCLISICLITVASAQPGPGPGGGGSPDEGIPIDGGTSLLAAAGLAYGAKKMVDKRKENKTD